MTALRVAALSVRAGDGTRLLAPLDLAVPAGGVATLIGESGAGKSLVCAAVAGSLPAGLACDGRIWLDGREISALSEAGRRALWSRKLFLLPQEPWHALAPARLVLAQTADTPRAGGATAAGARAIAVGLLSRLGLDPDIDGRRRPAELSGGMAQRVAVAAALGAPAGLVLVDEPTKGLDAALRDKVCHSLRLLLEAGRAVVLVTHDLKLAAAMGGEILVLRNGAVIERGPAGVVFERPRHDFTKNLVAAVPERWQMPPARRGADLLAAMGITITAGRGGAVLARGLDVAVARGQIVGLSGVSGCGKTTLGDVLVGLRAPAGGSVRWGENLHPGARQKLYQDPAASFAPWRRLGDSLADSLAAMGQPRSEMAARAAPILARLRLGADLLRRRPGEVSGGELQRLALARVLLHRPAFLFADEPTSRLDPLTQRDVAGLLAELAAEGMACLLASHDPDMLAALTSDILELS